MKGKLKITVGVSGSGKSTWAHKQWMENPDGVTIVNRDKIRELLFGFTESNINEYYSMEKLGKREKEVTRYEDTLIHDALNHGKEVIVDATHLSIKYLERFKYWNVPTEIIVLPIGNIQVCIDRDKSRERSVGEDVIKKQAEKYRSLMKELDKNPIDFSPTQIFQSTGKKECFIFDIDGTLAHMNRDTRSPYDWHKVGEDIQDAPTVATLKSLKSAGAEIIICTGRDGSCALETAKWLKDHDISYRYMYIRDEGDCRADWIIKEEFWRDISKTYNIMGMFDDRLQVVRRARALGLKVFNVEYNNF